MPNPISPPTPHAAPQPAMPAAARGTIGRRAVLGAAGAAGLLFAGLRHARAAGVTLTLYSAQHQQMVKMLTAGFTKATGIGVRIHAGEAPEIASQILREGARSPADVYFTENSPELTLLDEKGMLAKVDAATLAAVPARYSAASGNWVGVLARENVLAYNPAMIAEAALPASLMDLAGPGWKGKVAIAPSDADFLPLIDAVVALKGEKAALAWLRGLKTNAQIFDDDEGVIAAVDRGTVATGIINFYYWARLRTEQGAARTKSRVHHFTGGDVGALINVSGAAVLKSSRHAAAAQRFLAYLVSTPVQTAIAQGDVDFEYPLAKGVKPNPLLRPFDTLQPPDLSMAQLGDDRMAARLLRQAGLI
ncbi:MAG: extracellular solute-binding protein [Rhodospirillales bacterium]|nr:extracellular solute-binding protein [Rhodospirillales bacterium]